MPKMSSSCELNYYLSDFYREHFLITIEIGLKITNVLSLITDYC